MHEKQKGEKERSLRNNGRLRDDVTKRYEYVQNNNCWQWYKRTESGCASRCSPRHGIIVMRILRVKNSKYCASVSASFIISVVQVILKRKKV